MRAVSKIQRIWQKVWTFAVEPYNCHKFNTGRTYWLSESDRLFLMTMDFVSDFIIKTPEGRIYEKWYNNQEWNKGPYAVLQDEVVMDLMLNVQDMEVSERRSVLLLASYMEDEVNEQAYRIAISHITEESMKHIMALS